MNSKESQKLCFSWNFGVACIFVDSVEKIVLFVVIGSKDDKVDDALQDLCLGD